MDWYGQTVVFFARVARYRAFRWQGKDEEQHDQPESGQTAFFFNVGRVLALEETCKGRIAPGGPLGRSKQHTQAVGR